MNIGDEILWTYHDGEKLIERPGTILSVNSDQSYDIVLDQERNVPFEFIFINLNKTIPEKGDIVLYKKDEYHEALVMSVDMYSSSLQLKFIVRNLYF